MSDDPLDDLFGLEDEFYQQGYDAGIVDSVYAGTLEGKVFGIEKGYEKAFELARLQGRGLVWQARLASSSDDNTAVSNQKTSFGTLTPSLEPLAANARLQKNVEVLLTITHGEELSKQNDDDAVMKFEDHVVKANAKAKIIAAAIGEPLQPNNSNNSGIEDATGLKARH